jgi:branched-chain amino acid aminotransferase
MPYDIFSKNGQILPISEAAVPLASIEYAYGFGVYETVRVKNKAPLFIADHIDRLLKSAQIIALEHAFSEEAIKGFVQDLVSKIDSPAYNLKILLIGAPDPENASLYITCSSPFFPDKKMYRDGIKMITAHYERAYPRAKTLNMLQSYMAYHDAQRQGAYDALLINREGNITEGTRTNFFAIKGTSIYSPREKDILLGVTRKHVVEVARDNGYTLEEADIALQDLKEYDGAFLSSTSSKILPIKSVDDFEYAAISAELARLIGLFDAFMNFGT